MIRRTRSVLSLFTREEQGGSLAEYAIVLALVAVATIGAVSQLGSTIQSALDVQLENAASGSGSASAEAKKGKKGKKGKKAKKSKKGKKGKKGKKAKKGKKGKKK